MEDKKPPDPPLEFPAIPGMARRVNGSHLTCGDCAYYQASPKNVKMGTCHGNPPGLMFDPAGRPMAVRPAVTMDDRACRHVKKE